MGVFIIRPPYGDTSKLSFGKYFTDYMFLMKYNNEKGWHDGEIKKRAPIKLDPAALVLHYAQEIFEGMKSYVSEDGRILLFRPQENARRMNRSAYRLCMPAIPEQQFVESVSQLVVREKEWIPRNFGTAIYIRPTMIGIDASIGVKPSKEYLFYIILSPASDFYKEGHNPVSIYVDEQTVRVLGLGDVKTGANYAATLFAGKKAEEKGYSQVLYLDAKEHRYVEEIGTMNVFFVYDKEVVTPPLMGAISPGVTRDSVVVLARELGYKVDECSIDIEDVIRKIECGIIKEMFGTSTAAIVSPVGRIHYKGRDYVINNNKTGEVTEKLYSKLLNIQYGKIKENYGWVKEIGNL